MIKAFLNDVWLAVKVRLTIGDSRYRSPASS
jgi:hypothetical protein